MIRHVTARVGSRSPHTGTLAHSHTGRFNKLATSPRVGPPIDERAIIQLPVDDPRFGDRMKELVAQPVLIAVMDSYFQAEVELDAVTVIRNHGCRMGCDQKLRCDSYFSSPVCTVYTSC